MDVFDIRVLGFEDRAGDPVTDLARVFGIDARTAQKIVQRAPVIVKRGVDEQTAERFFNHLRGIGARVQLEKRVVQSMRPPEGPAAGQPSPPTPGPPAPVPVEAPILPPPEPGFGDFEPYSTSSPPAAFEMDGSQPGGFGPESLPVPDFDAVGLDPERFSRPPSMAPAAQGSVRPASGSLHPSARPGARTEPSGSIVPRDRMAPGAAHVEDGEVQEPFIPRLMRAFLYPFQRSALAIFVGIAVVSALLSLIPFIGAFLALGVQAIFFFRVIQHSGDGEDDLPQGTDFTDFGDLLVPSFRFLLAFLVPFVPAILSFYALGTDNPVVIPVAGLLALAGLAYMPASVMVASLTSGCLGPLNPAAGIMIMTRVPSAYTITTFCVAVVVMVNGLVMAAVYAATNLIPLPFLPGLIQNTAGLVLPTVAARMLGIFLHQNRHELGLGLGE
jgi:hypothetical protein